MWTLDEALTFVRKLQPLARSCGYHITVGGGVINKGASEHDLDLLAMEGSFDDPNFDQLTNLLVTEMGLIFREDSHKYAKIRLLKYYTEDNKKVDIVFPIIGNSHMGI